MFLFRGKDYVETGMNYATVATVSVSLTGAWQDKVQHGTETNRDT